MGEIISPGDEDVINAGQTDFFRPKEGEMYRVGICWAHKDDEGNYLIGDDAEAKFEAEQVYYLEDSEEFGYVISNTYLEGKFSNPPKPRVATVVVVYNETDARGNFPTENGDIQIDPDQWEVKPWMFGRDKFTKLSATAESFPLLEHDLRITCEDENFQDLDIRSAGKEKAIWRQSDQLRDQILKKADQASNEFFFGQDPDIERLKSYFNDDEIAPDVSENVEDYEDALDDVDVDL